MATQKLIFLKLVPQKMTQMLENSFITFYGFEFDPIVCYKKCSILSQPSNEPLIQAQTFHLTEVLAKIAHNT